MVGTVLFGFTVLYCLNPSTSLQEVSRCSLPRRGAAGGLGDFGPDLPHAGLSVRVAVRVGLAKALSSTRFRENDENPNSIRGKNQLFF